MKGAFLLCLAICALVAAVAAQNIPNPPRIKLPPLELPPDTDGTWGASHVVRANINNAFLTDRLDLAFPVSWNCTSP